MSLFDNLKRQKEAPKQPAFGQNTNEMIMTDIPSPEQIKEGAAIARLAINVIQDGFLVIDGRRIVKLINPVAVKMMGYADENLVLGLDIETCMDLEKSDGTKVPVEQNPVFRAIDENQTIKSRDFVLVSREDGKKSHIEINIVSTNTTKGIKIITFRDIDDELKAESEQSEFISTASHEMRTPVASIEGYIGLALNPQTATIDERARGYLEAAHKSSQHLGRLFRDLLDVTKLDDQRMRPHLIPLELTDFIKQLADEYIPKFKEKKLNYVFGNKDVNSSMHSLRQPIYTFADVDFLREIASNLIENAIKYTDEGGNVWVSVTSDDEKAIFSVSDTGMGISSSDLEHIFQKFYRVDNSQTREIGGTGLGLYLVKKRATAMNGTAWAESVYGKGSTFSVGLPRLSEDEFEKRKIALTNEMQAQKAQQEARMQEVMAFAQQQMTATQSDRVPTPAPQVTQPVAEQKPTAPPTQNN